VGLLCLVGLCAWATDKPEPNKPSSEEYLRESAVPRSTIDRFLRAGLGAV
jgi:hypothetical protein